MVLKIGLGIGLTISTLSQHSFASFCFSDPKIADGLKQTSVRSLGYIMVKIEYQVNNIRDIQAIQTVNEKTGKRTVDSVRIGDRQVDVSQRFWNSLFSKYGFSSKTFNYFEPAEVFDRIAERRSDDKIRVCLSMTDNDEGNPTVLAVSNHVKPVLEYDSILELLDGYELNGVINYADGVVSATHTPTSESDFDIRGDQFKPRYQTIIPIDGYGSPEVALGWDRVVCSNGAVAFGKVFSNKISGGNDMEAGLKRLSNVCENYGNDEGYDALRRRLVSSSESYASVLECSNAMKLITRSLGSTGIARADVRDAFDKFELIAGNPAMMYGLVTQTSASSKRLASLPSRATVYDLINFVTEMSTHKFDQEIERRKVYGHIGQLLSNEFDLEGTAADNRDFIDVFAANHNAYKKTQGQEVAGLEVAEMAD